MPTPVDNLSPLQWEWVYENQLALGNGERTADSYRQFIESASLGECGEADRGDQDSSSRRRKRTSEAAANEMPSPTSTLSMKTKCLGVRNIPQMKKSLAWGRQFKSLMAMKKNRRVTHAPCDLASWGRHSQPPQPQQQQQQPNMKTETKMETVERLVEGTGFTLDERSVVSLTSS